MGTKNNPGKYDCHAKAAPDEPIFTLLGPDPLAGYLVALWSRLRVGDEEGARRVFNTLMIKATNHLNYPRPNSNDRAKAQESNSCAFAMLYFADEPIPAVNQQNIGAAASKERDFTA